MKKDTNIKTLDFMCYHEGKIREAVMEEKTRSGHTDDIAARNGYTPDPTATQAVKNMDEVKYVTLSDGGVVYWPERWLRVIEAIRTWCKAEFGDDDIFLFTYRDKRKWQLIPLYLNIDQSTYSRRMSKLRTYGLQAAAQENLIKVF